MAVVFLRTCVLYIIIVFSLRIMGKRQIGELQPSEFVITILVSAAGRPAGARRQSPVTRHG